MTPQHDAGLEVRLVEAGRGAVWPATPDIRSAVLARIAVEALVPGGRRSVGPGGRGSQPVRSSLAARWPRPVARALILALVALLVLAGIAAALGFRLPGLDIGFTDRLPPVGAGLNLGSPVPVAEARAVTKPRVLVPASLRAPDAAFVITVDARRIVTLVYGAAPGAPILVGSDLALTVMAVPGDTDDMFLSKMLGPGSTIDEQAVGGSHGWWISGATHDLFIKNPDGSATLITSALAGDTLVFVRDGTLYRLESALGREATVAIAESMH